MEFANIKKFEQHPELAKEIELKVREKIIG